MTIRDSIYAISPSWLRAFVGEIKMYAYGVVIDALLAAGDQGVKARFPGAGTPSALPYIGRDRVLDRFPSETDDQYASRLAGFLDTWAMAGNAESILDQIAGYLGNPSGPALIRIVTNSGVWYTWQNGVITMHRSSPNNWNWDGLTSRWWRFWVVIQGVYTSGRKYGDGLKYAPGGVTYGSNATSNDVAAIRRIIAKWKPAHTYCENLIVSLDPSFLPPTDVFGSANLPDGTWGNATKQSGGVQVPARDARGRYLGQVL